MVQHLVHTLYPHVAYKGVYAMGNKKARADPVAALYEPHNAAPLLKQGAVLLGHLVSESLILDKGKGVMSYGRRIKKASVTRSVTV